MDQKRLEETRKKVNNAKEVGLTGWNLAAAVYDEYCEIVPDLLDYIAELEQKQAPRLPNVTPIDCSTDFNLRCPCCGYKFVSNIDGKYVAVVYAKHCPNCGQAIRWS